MRRHARCGRERAREVKNAETRDIGEIGDRNIVSKVLRNMVEDTPQASIIERMPRLDRHADDTNIQMRVHQPCSEQ